jgi:hypothetical protein
VQQQWTLAARPAGSLSAQGDADQPQHLDGLLTCLPLVHMLMQHDGFDDLLPHGMHPAERGHRLLEHQGDLSAPNSAHVLAVRCEFGQIDDLISVAAVEGFTPSERALAPDNAAGAIDNPQD